MSEHRTLGNFYRFLVLAPLTNKKVCDTNWFAPFENRECKDVI